jgi:thymidine kinase
MSKVYFRYGAMNSGKSTALLQVAYNYEERGMSVAILKPSVDGKGGDKIISRLGKSRKVDYLIKPGDNIAKLFLSTKASCILVDEAQFLEPAQVDKLFWHAVNNNTPVICYGIRTDFMLKGFPGATRLLEIAHSLEELKTICKCGKKAIFNARYVNDKIVTSGQQVAIDGTASTTYMSLCAQCYVKEST